MLVEVYTARFDASKSAHDIAKHVRFGATKAMLLFETPQDLLRAVEGGVDIKEVNLGSMAHSVARSS